MSNVAQRIEVGFDWTPKSVPFTYEVGGHVYPYTRQTDMIERPTDERYAAWTTPVGVQLTFAAEVVIPTDLTVLEYRWEFGDGAIGFGPTATHTYKIAVPQMAATLIVTDSLRRSRAVKRTLNLTPAVPVLIGLPLTVRTTSTIGGASGAALGGLSGTGTAIKDGIFSGGGQSAAAADGARVNDGVLVASAQSSFAATGTLVKTGQLSASGVANLVTAGYLVKSGTLAGSGASTFSVTGIIPQPYQAAVLATSGLQSYWKLDENTGTTVADSGVGAHSGTFGTLAAWGSGLVTGSSSGVYLGTTNRQNRVDFGDISAYDFAGTSAFTIELWVKVDASPSTGGFKRIIQKNTNTGWDIMTNIGSSTSNFRLERANENGGNSAEFANGVAHHIVATYDGATSKLYVDAHQETTQSTTTSVAAQTGRALTIGSQSDNDNGVPTITVDEVAIYNVALSGTTISNHYAAR